MHPDDPTNTAVATAPERATMQPGGVFVVIAGPDQGKSVRLHDLVISIGSSPECTLTLTDRRVSRKHLLAALDGGRALVRDLGSTNGSYVAGARFTQIVVEYGVIVQVGQTLDLVGRIGLGRSRSRRRGRSFLVPLVVVLLPTTTARPAGRVGRTADEQCRPAACSASYESHVGLLLRAGCVRRCPADDASRPANEHPGSTTSRFPLNFGES